MPPLIPIPSRTRVCLALRKGHHVLTASRLLQLYMKTVKNEAFFNFKFGTGRNKNLVVNLTEFVDSKVYAGSSSDSDSDSDSGSSYGH